MSSEAKKSSKAKPNPLKSSAPGPAGLACSVVLVGLMGAGKTTIGRRLASQLDLSFVDADQEIAEAAGCSVSDIFELYGEQVFRDLEKRVMLRLLSASPAVIATGGGAFVNDSIREAVHEKALSVWLKADLDVLVERTARRDTRPLLRTGDRREILAKLMQDRYPLYAEADIVIESDTGAHEEVVNDILDALAMRKWRKEARSEDSPDA